jgi:hypothetical protein
MFVAGALFGASIGVAAPQKRAFSLAGIIGADDLLGEYL